VSELVNSALWPAVSESADREQVQEHPKPKPTVAIFAEPLLAPSMTFIRAQASALTEFTAVYVSPQRASPSLEVPSDRVVVLCDDPRASQFWNRLQQIPFKVFGHAPLFFRKVEKFHPVLVHAHFGPAALTALPLVRFLRVPLIATFHGYDATLTEEFAKRHSTYRDRVYWRRRGILKREGSLFIAVSRFVEKQILEQGFPPEKIQVHYTGVDTDFFQPNEATFRGPTVLFVANLTEKKGCEYLLRAMGEVQSARPEVELVLIGDGPLRSSLEQMARQKLQKYRFLGVQPPETVRDWMNRAKVLSVPSVRASSGDSEGFGMVFAEAQAMGLPVASFASGGIPEAVAHGETGLLAEERDWRTLARNILLLLGNDILWTQMSMAGRRRIRRLFDLRSQVKLLEDLYVRVLAVPTRDKRELGARG
jgi:colanic acid/amylovoran biosynthesis glycosyltransferase